MRTASLKAMGLAGVVICGAVIVIQFVRPGLVVGPVTAEINAPAEVKQILRQSCYNCHSNDTKLSWFDKVVPVSWLVTSDVKAARRHINFSEMGRLPENQQKAILFEAVNNIQLGAMPLPSYRVMHPHATVTAEQLAVLRAYLTSPTSQRSDERNPGAESPHKNVEVRRGQVLSNVRPAPNGIEFIPDYNNWKTISSTDRFDNNTVRVVLGNDVAVKAISAVHINPWPDGTILAKVVWKKQMDQTGIAHAGQLLHIAFMIRDSKKYSATKNWGYAWWNGEELQPYGKDASFAHECVECHTPLRKNDYVFTTPIARPR